MVHHTILYFLLNLFLGLLIQILMQYCTYRCQITLLPRTLDIHINIACKRQEILCRK